jgi:hypothetical protein
MAMSAVVIVKMRSKKLGRPFGRGGDHQETGVRTQCEQALKVSCLDPLGTDTVDSCEGAHKGQSEVKKIDGLVRQMHRSSIRLLRVNCDSGEIAAYGK